MNANEALRLVSLYVSGEFEEERKGYEEIDGSKDWLNYARAEYIRGMANSYARVSREVSRLQKMVTETARKQ